MPTKLRRLAITEVALVDDGDNPGADIVIAKRRETDPDDSVEDTDTNDVDVNKGKETEMEFDINKIPEEFRKSVQGAIEAATAKATTDAVEKAKTTTAVAATSEPKIEIPEVVQKAMDRQQEEITKLRKELDDRAESESIAKAKASYGAFAEVESIGKALHKLDKVDATLAADVRKCLAAAQAIAKKTGAITKQIGSAGEASAKTADQQLEDLAKAKAKAESLSFAKAYETVLNENPELYAESAKDSVIVVNGDE